MKKLNIYTAILLSCSFFGCSSLMADDFQCPTGEALGFSYKNGKATVNGIRYDVGPGIQNPTPDYFKTLNLNVVKVFPGIVKRTKKVTFYMHCHYKSTDPKYPDAHAIVTPNLTESRQCTVKGGQFYRGESNSTVSYYSCPSAQDCVITCVKN